MKNKKHIAMRCNKEQFEAIKPKLEGKVIFNSVSIYEFKKYKYLINCDVGMISNISKSGFKHAWENVEEIHEEWNEKIFLEACGIEVEPVFEITKEQILLLHKDAENDTPQLVTTDLKKWFPEVFKPVLDVGKWYKSGYGGLWFVEDFKDNGKTQTSYGISKYGEWCDRSCTRKSKELVLATPEEVTEALKNEAVRRGFKLGVCIDRYFDNDLGIEVINDTKFKDDSEFYYCIEEDYLEHHGFVIYSKGKWANILKTKTIQQAQELLKELGHEIKIV